ncbi:MAG TPA: hypothetical protein VFI16_04925 [Anaeromyxobacteraceae bacterium]|nr:hypothetical protein [Anaeromyxobacteraceae bacterium]
MTAWLASLLLAASGEPAIGWTPRRVVLGETTRLPLRVRVPGAAPGAPPPRLRASEGILGDPERSGAEEWTAPLDLPGGGPPLLAIVSAVHEGPGERAQVAFAAIPLRGRAAVPVETEPGARVVIDLGGDLIGPFTADERGRLEVPVDVPPGVTSARVRAAGPGGRTDRVVELAGTPPGRIAVEAVPAGPGRLRLEVFVAGGARPGEVVLEADGARVSSPRPVPGRADRLTAAAEGPPGEVRVRAWVRGAEASRDEVSARIAAPPPGRARPGPAAAPDREPAAARERSGPAAPIPPRTASLAAGYRARPGRTGGAEMALALGWPLARRGELVLGVSGLAFAHGAGAPAGATAVEIGLAPEGMLLAEIPGAVLLAALGPTVGIACHSDRGLADGCSAALGVSARLGLAWRLPGSAGARLTAEAGLRELVAGGGRARESGLAGGLGVTVGLALEAPP